MNRLIPHSSKFATRVYSKLKPWNRGKRQGKGGGAVAYYSIILSQLVSWLAFFNDPINYKPYYSAQSRNNMDRWKFEIMRHSWREHYRWIGKYVILVLCILQRQCYWFIGHLLVGSIFSPFIRVYIGSWRCSWRSVGYRKVVTYRCKKKIDLATSVGNERLDEQKWNRLTCYVFMFLYQMINLGVLSLV